jgi:hypothetical protein
MVDFLYGKDMMEMLIGMIAPKMIFHILWVGGTSTSARR